ncbi:MAG: hypothetical protein MRY49_02465 [Candidatus Pacebacteria bacterium]|nr:hypothetical protein [Candidatus Paceibacterota bacterium]
MKLKIAFSFMMYAGFFGLFQADTTIQIPQKPTYNAQNLPILEASNSPFSNSVGGAEIVIDDAALYPEVGSGSVSITQVVLLKVVTRLVPM